MRRSSRTVVLCLAMAVVLTAPIIGPARAGTMQTYIVLYNAQAVPADAARTITNAGGVFVYAYDAIGVVIARSDSPLFRDTLLADSRIENVSSTAGFATRLRDVVTTDASAPSQIVPGPPVTDNDSLSPLQWDMVQIHTPEAHAITGGSRHGFNVTNNSYFADPFYLNCHNDPVQRAIWKAEQRAIRFAMSQGVTVVAAVGNFADDLAHPTMDLQSPDDTTPVARAVHNDCVDIPAEIAGVLGVSAVGNLGRKSFYSSYGLGVVEVAAPGGDSILQQTPAAPNGRVLSTWPSTLLTVTCLPARRLVDASGATYCYQQGTSMASPHAAGVAALVASQGRVKPGQIAATVQLTADPVSCPIPTTVSLYAFFPSQNNGAPQACQGSSGSNSWYGKGQVNALSAVTGP